MEFKKTEPQYNTKSEKLHEIKWFAKDNMATLPTMTMTRLAVLAIPTDWVTTRSAVWFSRSYRDYFSTPAALSTRIILRLQFHYTHPRKASKLCSRDERNEVNVVAGILLSSPRDLDLIGDR